MAISLIIVYILWSAFGYIGPTFSRDVLTYQQETLREKYKLPPLEEETGAAGEIPPSLREVMKSSNGQEEMTTQSTTTSNTSTASESSGNTTTSGSIQQGQQQQQQPQAT